MEHRSTRAATIGWGRLAVVAVAAALAVAGCAKGEAGAPAADPAVDAPALPERAQRATPAPPFVLTRANVRANIAQMRGHLDSLLWDSGAASDRRYLLLGDAPPFSVGPQAWLMPETGAAEVVGDWHARGRVLARVRVFGDAGYPRLHLQPGDNYVCVRRGPQNTWLAFVVSMRNGTLTTDEVDMTLRFKDGKHTWARFIVGDQDDDMCFPCNSGWCCTDEL